MFVLIKDLILENKQLTSDDKIILCMLNSFRKADASYWGSYNYLADKVGLSVDTVRDVCNKFITVGLLIQEQNGLKLAFDPDTRFIDHFAPYPGTFNEEKFVDKLNELLNQGYQSIAESDFYIQLIHPDKPGLVMLNKFQKKDGNYA